MSAELEELCFLLGWAGGQIPIYLEGEPTPELRLPAIEAAARLERELPRWEGRLSRQVEIGLPEDRRLASPHQSTVLWAWTESTEALRRAWGFRLRPSLVLSVGHGSRRLLLWALNEPVLYVRVEAANKRLAYALHAPQKYARLEKLRVPVPGTCVRVGRKRPAPVRVTLREERVYSPQPFERLKDPPTPYMQRLREGKVKRR